MTTGSWDSPIGADDRPTTPVGLPAQPGPPDEPRLAAAAPQALLH